MLIRRLEFSGIGPFSGHHEINMDELTAQGVFLIEGPTGSGKSTLIDAIVFALFGSVAGKNSTDQRMRSSRAPLDQLSWVDLVFTVASGTYRVRRVPAQLTKKKRGTGTTEIKHTASLWKLSESALAEHDWEAGTPLATQARETNQIIADIVGMNKNQFVQTVVLPQGQFAEFLRLNSKDRGALLERIFHTESYRDFTEKLRELSGSATAQITEAFNRYCSDLDVWLSSNGLDEETLNAVNEQRAGALSNVFPLNTSIDSDLLAEIEKAVEDLESRAKREHDALEAARALEKSSAEALNAGEQLARHLERRSSLLAQQMELDQQLPSITKLEAALEKHTAAQLVAPRINDLYATQSAREEAEQNAETASVHAHEELSKAASEHPELADVLESWATRTVFSQRDETINLLGEQLGALAEAESTEESLAQCLENIEHYSDKITELNRELQENQATLATLPEKLRSIENDYAQALSTASTLPSLEKDADRIYNLSTLEQEAASLEEGLTQQKISLEHAITEHAAAKKDFDDMYARWISSAAADLATHLTEGKPCPVCGSAEHPQIALPHKEHASQEMVDSAQAHADQKWARVTSLNTELASTEARLETLRKQLGNHTHESLEEAQKSLETQIAAAHTAHDSAQQLEQEKTELRTVQESLEAHIHAATVECAGHEASMSATQKTAHEYRDTLERHIGSFSSIAEKRGCITSIRSSLVDARNAHEALIAAQNTEQRASNELATALESSPFSSLSEASDAALTSDREQEAALQIAAFRDTYSGVAAQLEQPEISSLKGTETVDCEALAAAHTAAQEALSQAADSATRCAQEAHIAKTAAASVHKAHTRWHTAATAAGPITRLANICTAGDASLTSIPLNIWVLLRRFEVVVERANEHLKDISRGRYELIRVDESSGRRKAGLDVRVIDREGSPNGDEERDTASLSGGETFYTSLSLALALAEVVQEEQGGIRIDTLIIDEGFGTLSEDVREEVMRTLTSLCSHGRVVGIVSHIAELKQLIPNRISMSRLANGSSTLTTVC